MRDGMDLTGRGATARAAGRIGILTLAAGMAWATGCLAADGANTPAKKSGTWLTVADSGGQTEFSAVGSFRARQSARLGFQVSGRVQNVRGNDGKLRDADELLDFVPAVIELVIAERGDVDVQEICKLVDRFAMEDGGDGRALDEIAGVEVDARRAVSALIAQHGGEICEASHAVAVRLQVGVKVVRVEDGERADVGLCGKQSGA